MNMQILLVFILSWWVLDIASTVHIKKGYKRLYASVGSPALFISIQSNNTEYLNRLISFRPYKEFSIRMRLLFMCHATLWWVIVLNVVWALLKQLP